MKEEVISDDGMYKKVRLWCETREEVEASFHAPELRDQIESSRKALYAQMKPWINEDGPVLVVGSSVDPITGARIPDEEEEYIALKKDSPLHVQDARDAYLGLWWLLRYLVDRKCEIIARCALLAGIHMERSYARTFAPIIKTAEDRQEAQNAGAKRGAMSKADKSQERARKIRRFVHSETARGVKITLAKKAAAKKFKCSLSTVHNAFKQPEIHE